MTDPDSSDAIAIANARSLNTLSRAITLSLGQFSLILARCNYATVRSEMVQQLQQICAVECRELHLTPSVKTLYTTIQAELEGHHPDALIVYGLEWVTAIDQVLTSTNQIREEFRKNFQFPLVLWVNDEILQKLIQRAPDFKSWAATSIKFEIATDQLIAHLHQTIEAAFTSVLDLGASRFLDHRALDQTLGADHSLELEFAAKDLQQRGQRLLPILEVGLPFLRGRSADANRDRPKAKQLYEDSLRAWEQHQGRDTLGSNDASYISNAYSDQSQTLPLTYRGCILFYLGLWWRQDAILHRAQYQLACLNAKDYFQQCIESFLQSDRPELAARFINAWGEVLIRLENIPELATVADLAVQLHEQHSPPVRLAYGYGLRAEVALYQANWEAAKADAEQALRTNELDWAALPSQDRSPDATAPHLTDNHAETALHWDLERRYYRNWYLLLLAQSERFLHLLPAAIEHLEIARSDSNPQYDPALYIQILETLRSLYFEQGNYLQAFQIKSEQRSIEQQYGLRAFIGAGRLQPTRQVINPGLVTAAQSVSVAQEIVASGRQQDVNRLIERITRSDCKLSVIYGQSGVGKSSTVRAGLVPALKQLTIEARDILPLLLDVYTDWDGALRRQLLAAIPDRPPLDTDPLNSYSLDGNSSVELILKQFQQYVDQNLLVVLIFDQFEEFFFVYKDREKRLIFYQFLSRCLNLPFVKVVLSLREDYLHFLLEFNRLGSLDVIDNNILDREILYYLGNFSCADARLVIQSLTERSQVYLEPLLIETLVQDLAGQTGEVRPIELQIVGAQLETEKITTLDQYQQQGTKEKLVERFLEGVVQDCGRENESTARLVLYLLTDENGTRPLKTRAELAADLVAEVSQLDGILEILVASGLVFLLPDVPTDRYQLVHDYLVLFIRQQQGLGLLAELKKLRQQEQLSQAEIERLRNEKQLLAELSEAKEQRKRSEDRLNRFLRWMLVGASVGLLALAYLAVQAIRAEQRAQARRIDALNQKQRAEVNQIQAMSISAEAILPNDQLEALLTSVKMGKLLQDTADLPESIRLKGVSALQQTVYEVQERNRLQEHTDQVHHVSFSPDGNYLASASQDHTVRLWTAAGQLLKVLKGHTDTVRSVAFSPDGKQIASAGDDFKIKIWNLDGTNLYTISGHKAEVYSVRFSPDGKQLASASLDGTVKLWNRQGKLIRSLNRSGSQMFSLAFSPDSRFLVAAGRNGLIQLWESDGSWVATLGGHDGSVYSVGFSPDSKTIVSASSDRSLKLWNTNGVLLSTLVGHNDEVWSAKFSPDGRTIASASSDRTIKLWSRNGRLLRTLAGHGDWVYDVDFRPDGQMLASGSRDKTVRFWSAKSTLRQNFTGHDDTVWNVHFSPDGKTLLSASADATLKLWNLDGRLLNTLQGHTGSVISAKFHPSGRMLVSGGTDETVRLWSTDGKLLNTIKGHTGEVYSVSFSPDGKQIVSGGLDGTVKLWTLNGQPIRQISGPYGNSVYSAVFSPDGQLIATATKDKLVKLWSANGILQQTLTGHEDEVYSVAFSPDGELLASASRDTTIKLWNVRTGEFLRSLEDHSYSVESVAFSPDGRTIASVSDDQTIKLWNAADGTLLKTLDGHSNWVYGISFSPDGKMLASSSKDRTIRLWDTETLDFSSLLNRGCEFLRDYLKTNARFDHSEDEMMCDP